MSAIRRVAIVGLGAAGGFALAGLRGIPGAICVAGIDPRGRSAPAAGGLGADVGVELKHLERVAPLDLVIVATPTPDHATSAAAVLESARAPSRLWIEKPLSSTRAGLAVIRGAAAGGDAQVLLHTAYAPEVLWAAERVAGWRDAHGRLLEVTCDFNDPYSEAAEDRAAVLGDAWTDSGINALSVVARFVRLQGLVAASGAPPLSTHARFAGTDGEDRVAVTISTTWTPDSAEKRTVARLADGTTITLDHRAASAIVSDGGGATLELHEFGRRPLGDRYASMFGSYAANDRLTFSRYVQDALHEHLYAVKEDVGKP